jgi:uroporphyrinogen-III decarboxylase
LLPYIAQTGATAVESLSEPPLGDTRVTEALDALAPAGMCVIGGLSPVLLAMGTREEVKQEVLRLLEATQGYDNYILATGDPVAPETPDDNVVAAGEAWREYYGA